MAFFDELGKKISQTSQGVVQKTKDTAETLKLNSAISEEEKRIQTYYRDLGKAYYDTYANAPDVAFADIINGIKESESKIQQHKEQIIRLKGIVSCPNCGGEVANNALFCSLCGYRMNPQPQAATAPAQQFCTICGNTLKAGAQFCTACGTKVTVAAPQQEAVSQAPVQPIVPQPEMIPEVPVQPVVPQPEIIPEVPVQPVVPQPEIVPEVPVEPIIPQPETVPEAETVSPAEEDSHQCPVCHAAVPAGYFFCTSCGTPMNRPEEPQTPQVNTCPNCNAVLPDDAMFCTSCGFALQGTPVPAVRSCTNCGKTLEDDAMFCTNCGTPAAQ